MEKETKNQTPTKAKKGELSAETFLEPLRKVGNTLKKRARFIVTILVLLVVTYNAYLANSTIRNANDTSVVAESSKAIPQNFNKAIIEKVNALRDKTTVDTISLPSGRINPFAE